MLAGWALTDEERDKYIGALHENLAVLRMKAGISQVDLCNILGVTRQTYNAIETKRKRMMWPTYLSLIFFFDSISETRETLRSLPCYPQELLIRLNNGKNLEPGLFGQSDLNDVIKELDDQALHTLRTMILVEYARCKKLPGDIVLKAYDGTEFFETAKDANVENAIRNIKNRKN